jgi:SSS family solute:Na+ symporter
VILDIAIIIAYFVVILVAGWRSSRGIKNFCEFSVGDRNFSSFVITVAIFATMIGGGSTLGASERFFNVGIIYLISLFGCTIRDMAVAFVIVPCFYEFEDCQTAGDIMARFYGRTGRIATGIAGFLSSAISLALQISAFGYLGVYFLGLPHWLGVVIGAGITIFYTALGGLRAVTVTDAIQFSIIVVGVPLVFAGAAEVGGGYRGILAFTPPEHLSLFPDFDTGLRCYSMFFVFLFSVLDPALLQRLFMSRNTFMVKRALMRAAFLYLPFFTMIAYIALVALMFNPHLDPSLSFPYMVDQLLPVVVKGVAIVSLLSVLMSSADSFLHVAGVMFTNDVLNPLLKSELSPKAKLMTARVSTLLIGAIAVGVALFVTSMYEILLISYAFWTPAIVVPLAAAILGFRASLRAFILSGVGGVISYLVWELWVYSTIPVEAIVPAFLTSLAVFIAIFWMEKRPARRKMSSSTLQRDWLKTASISQNFSKSAASGRD